MERASGEDSQQEVSPERRRHRQMVLLVTPGVGLSGETRAAEEEAVMELLFQKGSTGLVPACEEATEWLRKKKLGATILVEPHEMRNGAFFRKWFALVTFAFEQWSDVVEPQEFRGVPVLPAFERFRKDVTILAGYYAPVVNLKGETRIEAASISWAKMDEDTFGKLFDATIQVLLNKVFNGRVCHQMNDRELREIAAQVMEFAA